MATAKARTRHHSSSSSSTESINSIPISDDDESLPPIILDSKPRRSHKSEKVKSSPIPAPTKIETKPEPTPTKIEPKPESTPKSEHKSKSDKPKSERHHKSEHREHKSDRIKSEHKSDRVKSEHRSSKTDENGATKKRTKKKPPPPRPSAPPPPEVILKIVATNSIDIDDITAFPPSIIQLIKPIATIPETTVVLASPPKRPITPIPDKAAATNPTKNNSEKNNSIETEPDGNKDGSRKSSNAGSIEGSDGPSTPRWKRLVDTSSGIWQTSTSKISSSKANVSNKFTSVVLLAKKAS